MMIRSAALFLLLLLLFTAPSLSAQEALQPYDASGRYRTSGVEVQVTGAFGEGRDVLLGWGMLSAGGRAGRWMQRTELMAGVQLGDRLLNGAMLGPRVSLALAVPGWYTELERGIRAEPYLLLDGAAYSVADFGDADEEVAFGVSPAISAGVGLRLFENEWDISLTQLEVVVQQRFGFAEQGPEIHVRLGTATPRRRPGHAADPHPDGPASLPPPPPHR
jgi:hypothetical protein